MISGWYNIRVNSNLYPGQLHSSSALPTVPRRPPRPYSSLRYPLPSPHPAKERNLLSSTPFIFMHLRIALFATPLLSNLCITARGCTPKAPPSSTRTHKTPPCAPFLFNHLRIALFANSLFSHSCKLMGGVPPLRSYPLRPAPASPRPRSTVALPGAAWCIIPRRGPLQIEASMRRRRRGKP